MPKIVALAKQCGMQYLVVTTKHHDGFAMYHSKVDAYNVYDATPFHRDIIGELAEACQKPGSSLACITHKTSTGTIRTAAATSQTMSKPLARLGIIVGTFLTKIKNFDLCFDNKILPQIKEIMSNYGDIATAWFDVPMTLSEAQSQTIYDTVRELQPNCLINSRLGNGKYDFVSLGDNEIPKTKKT